MPRKLKLSLSFLSLMVLALLLPSCKLSRNNPLVGVQVVPNSASVTAVGENVQFKALGSYSDGSSKDITGQVTWQSTDQSVATVNSSGLATSAGPGTVSIVAVQGGLSGTATLDSNPRELTALTIIPAAGAQQVYAVGQTAQFIAIGTFSATPTTQDVTDQVSWISADVDLATINSTGLATSLTCTTPSGDGCVTIITASATNLAGATITATSDLTTNNAVNNPPLPSLTVYKVGQGAGTVVSTSAPGINCGSGASCTANFPLNSTVTLSATPASGSLFVGWSANCTPITNPVCNVPMQNNQTVGAIFALNPTP